MYTLELVESNNMLKKMHKFFKSLDVVTDLPDFKRYKMFSELGEAYVILDKKGNVCGGLLQYSMPKHNSIISYYIPEDTRAKGISWRVFEKCRAFQMKYPNKKTYAVTKHPHTWRQFAKQIKGNLYQVMIPKV